MKPPAAVAWEKEQAFSMEEVELEKPHEEGGSDPCRGGRGLPHGPDRPRPGRGTLCRSGGGTLKLVLRSS